MKTEGPEIFVLAWGRRLGEQVSGAIRIARSSGAPTSRHIQGQQGEYVQYVNGYWEPRTNFKEDWKIFLLVQWRF